MHEVKIKKDNNKENINVSLNNDKEKTTIQFNFNLEVKGADEVIKLSRKIEKNFKLANDIYCSVEVKSKRSPEKRLSHRSGEGIRPKYSLKKYKKFLKEGWKVGEIDARLPRGNDQTVYFRPIEIQIKDETFISEAHAEICGDKNKVLLRKLTDRANIILDENNI